MQGFLAGTYFPRFGECVTALSGLMAEGKLEARETVVEGMDKVSQREARFWQL